MLVDEGKFEEIRRNGLAKVWTEVMKIMKAAWQNAGTISV
jgi:hypothetical protein